MAGLVIVSEGESDEPPHAPDRLPRSHLQVRSGGGGRCPLWGYATVRLPYLRPLGLPRGPARGAVPVPGYGVPMSRTSRLSRRRASTSDPMPESVGRPGRV
jgi:hypothetical protein